MDQKLTLADHETVSKSMSRAHFRDCEIWSETTNGGDFLISAGHNKKKNQYDLLEILRTDPCTDYGIHFTPRNTQTRILEETLCKHRAFIAKCDDISNKYGVMGQAKIPAFSTRKN